MIKVTFDEYGSYVTDSLYQWDLNHILTITGLNLAVAPEIHFVNGTTAEAIRRQAIMDPSGVITTDIPKSLLQKPYKITAYVCICEGDTFRSIYEIAIPIKARNKPKDYTADDEASVSYKNGFESGREVGYNDGYTVGYNDGQDVGKQTQSNEFWDSYMYGANNCTMRFANMGWCANNFYPNHDMRPGNATQMFMNFSYGREPVLDLVERLEECGVELDFSNCVGFNAMLSYANINHIGVVDCTGSKSAVGVFGEARELVTVDKWIVHEGITDYRNAFQNANNLQNITVEGTIAGYSINLQWSPLSVDSMKSIISCLKNYSGTNYELTYSVKFSDACWSALEADSTAPDGKTWKNYVFNLGWNT